MRSKLSAMTARTPSSRVALGRPVSRGAGAVFLAREHHERHALRLVGHGRVVDRHLGAVRHVAGDAALGAGRELVADADVGKGAAHHHVVVAAPRAVGVEVPARNLPFQQVRAAGGLGADGAGGRDVVGGDGVAEEAEDPRAADVLRRLRLRRHALEVGRVLHVGAARIPGVGLPGSAAIERQSSSPVKTSP